MDIFKTTGNRPVVYEQRNINKKETSQEQSGSLNSDKNNIRQLFSEASVYDEVNYHSYSQEYFREINMSMSNGISGGMEKYEEIYNEITKNTQEGKTRDSLYKMLNQAFESSTSFYADNMASSIWALSGVKLKVEIPALGTHTMIKPDNSAFQTMNKNRKATINEFKDMFSNMLNYFQKNGSFSGITDSAISAGSRSFTINDFNELSTGLIKELTNLEKSGASNDKVSAQVNQSDLSDYAKKFLNDIIPS